MALVKCPRCELNYMQSTDKVCAVCKREMKGEDEHETVDICSNCGERPAISGEEFCAVCLKEMTNTEGFAAEDSAEIVDESAMDLSGASEIDEIEIDLDLDDESIPEGEFKVIKRELGDDDEGDFATVSLSELEEDEDKDDEEEDQ